MPDYKLNPDYCEHCKGTGWTTESHSCEWCNPGGEFRSIKEQPKYIEIKKRKARLKKPACERLPHVCRRKAKPAANCGLPSRSCPFRHATA